MTGGNYEGSKIQTNGLIRLNMASKYLKKSTFHDDKNCMAVFLNIDKL